MRSLIEKHDWSPAPALQRCCCFQNDSLEVFRCPSQNPVGQRNLADEAADQEAQRDGDEHRDTKFEQRIQRHHVESIGKTDEHRGMDEVDRIDTCG